MYSIIKQKMRKKNGGVSPSASSVKDTATGSKSYNNFKKEAGSATLRNRDHFSSNMKAPTILTRRNTEVIKPSVYKGDGKMIKMRK